MSTIIYLSLLPFGAQEERMRLVEEHANLDHGFQIAISICLILALCVIGGLIASLMLQPEFLFYRFTDHPVGQYR